MNWEQTRARAEVFKALGQPVRLRVAIALREGERSVSDLHKLVPVTMATLSRHLAVMKRAGLVRERHQGLHVFYRHASPLLPGLLDGGERILAQRTESPSGNG